MSKLLDRLERISKGAPSYMGFGAAARAEKFAPMALVGLLSDPAKATQGATLLARIGADGALIMGMSTTDIPEEVARALSGVPWGIKVQELKDAELSACKEKGCDFLALAPECAVPVPLENEDTGVILCIDHNMEERYLRAIEDLPVDAVLLPMLHIQPPLTLQHLITIGSVRGAFSKYMFLELPALPSMAELRALKDAGVDGLVVDVATVGEGELEAFKDRLMTMPRRHRERSARPSAVLPRAGFPIPKGPGGDEEDEEEDHLRLDQPGSPP